MKYLYSELTLDHATDNLDVSSLKSKFLPDLVMFKYNLLLYLLSPFIFIKLLLYSKEFNKIIIYIHTKIFGKKN